MGCAGLEMIAIISGMQWAIYPITGTPAVLCSTGNICVRWKTAAINGREPFLALSRPAFLEATARIFEK